MEMWSLHVRSIVDFKAIASKPELIWCTVWRVWRNCFHETVVFLKRMKSNKIHYLSQKIHLKSWSALEVGDCSCHTPHQYLDVKVTLNNIPLCFLHKKICLSLGNFLVKSLTHLVCVEWYFAVCFDVPGGDSKLFSWVH